MLKNKIKMFLISLGLVCVIITVSIFGGIGSKGNKAYANSNSNKSTYSMKQQSVDLQDVKDVLKGIQGSDVKPNSRGRILIYSSHSCEKNVDSSILEVSSDLTKKLEKKGFNVEHDKSLFADMQGYNRSYYSSGAMLDKKDLSKYVLVIDCHMDSTPSKMTTNYKDMDVAKLMFPNLSENPNLKAETNIVDRIKKGLNTFSDKIYRENVTHYRRGINFYSLNKSPNMILMEIGSDKNDFLSCQRANTLVSSAIERAFK